jgi:hypothetical protein
MRGHLHIEELAKLVAEFSPSPKASQPEKSMM